MAIIKCAECGKEISDTADRCPNCGYVTKAGQEKTEGKNLLALYVLAFAAAIVGVFMLMSGNIGIGIFLAVFGVVWINLLNKQGKKFLEEGNDKAK